MHGDRALNRIFQSGTIQVILNAEFDLPMTKTNLHTVNWSFTVTVEIIY
jgi:hypothetical protein